MNERISDNAKNIVLSLLEPFGYFTQHHSSNNNSNDNNNNDNNDTFSKESGAHEPLK